MNNKLQANHLRVVRRPSGEYDISFDYDEQAKDLLKAMIPSVQWMPHRKIWSAGPRSGTKVRAWVSQLRQVSDTELADLVANAVIEFRREFRIIADIAVLPRELPVSGELVYSDARVRVNTWSFSLSGDAQCLRLIEAAASGRWSMNDYLVPAEAMPALVRDLKAAFTQAMEAEAKAAEVARGATGNVYDVIQRHRAKRAAAAAADQAKELANA